MVAREAYDVHLQGFADEREVVVELMTGGCLS